MDVLLPGNEVEAFGQRYTLEPLILSEAFFQEISQVVGMAEVIVLADSMLIGKTVVEAELRARAGLTVLGLRRGQTAWETGLLKEKLKVGDTLLVVASWTHIKQLRSDNKDVLLLTLPTEFDEVLPVGGKALHAIFCLALVVSLMVFGVVPNVQAALLGCLLMGVLGCIDLNSSYRAIDWKTIVLLAGMMPFSTALERTGGVKLMTDGLIAVVGGAGTYGVQSLNSVPSGTAVSLAAPVGTMAAWTNRRVPAVGNSSNESPNSKPGSAS